MQDQDRLIELETTVTFQGDLIHKLEELASKQQLELHRLEKRLEEIEAQVKELAPSMVRDQADETPPPHY